MSRVCAVTGVLDVLGLVITALEQARVRYTIGGSFASSFAGEPRASSHPRRSSGSSSPAAVP